MQIQDRKRGGSSEPRMNARNSAGVRRSRRVMRVIASSRSVTVSGLPLASWPFEVVPHELVGVEFRGVRRQPLDVETGMAGADMLDLRPAVDRAAVPEHDDRAREVSEEEPQEERDLDLRDVVAVEVRVQPAAMPPRAHGQRGDRRDLVAPVAVAQQRCLAPRRPGAAHRGQQEKPALVEEDQIRLQAPGFFLGSSGFRVGTVTG